MFWLYQQLLDDPNPNPPIYISKWEQDFRVSPNTRNYDTTKRSTQNITSQQTNYKVLTCWYLVTVRITKFVPPYTHNCFWAQVPPEKLPSFPVWSQRQEQKGNITKGNTGNQRVYNVDFSHFIQNNTFWMEFHLKMAEIYKGYAHPFLHTRCIISGRQWGCLIWERRGRAGKTGKNITHAICCCICL